ncbi:apolipoprotein N-acyltransferase [Amycolatopsis carbonis]|uniref:Apolipoprotein N-acyltransferase n=1 Tax=Amycolatopsis carbonis TaxID=715471 RepID=A0A9Y2IBG8_9PSEU|nr:apolipoprotein N-acyltransferase [Amycolatopsis sp. 2-15]WIX77017.1 apolipoprotein N-acyltransferase [Amycolatopsis sp. 2-15]
MALLIGCLVALAHPAADAWWLGWIGLVPLVLLLARAGSYGEAAWRSSLAAVGYFLTVLQWLLPNVGFLALVVGVVAGALWVPFGLATYRLLRDPSVARVALAVVVLPSVWVTVEALRSWEGLGGPWGLVGLTQWQVRPVLAVASLGGVWLLSFVVVAVNVGLAAPFLPGAGRAARLLGGGLAVVFAALAVGYGLLRPEPVVTGSFRVVGVQPGVVYGGPERFAAHLGLTHRAAGLGQDVVVWGQSSMPFDPARRPDVVARLRQAAATAGSDVLVNVDARAADGRIRKTTQQYGPGGLVGTYEKRRLVPFGEYVPMRPLLGKVLQGTAIAEEDRAPGREPALLRVGGTRVGPLISYESIFPDLRRELVRLHADVTVVQGSLTSFHGTWAQPQQASAEAVRAVESGRSAVLVELNGTSAAFDARGRQLAWLPPDSHGIFVVDVPVYEEITPYVRWGDWVPRTAGTITAVGVVLLVARAVRSRLS